MISLYKKLADAKSQLCGTEFVAVRRPHGLSVMSLRLALATGAEVI